MKTNTALLNRPPDPGTPTVASDFEGTLSTGVTAWGLHNYLVEHGRAWEAYAMLLRMMPGFQLKKMLGRPMRQHKVAYMRAMLRLFAGMDRQAFSDVAEWIVEHTLWPKMRPNVVRELEGHLAEGRRVLIVTGMFEPLLEQLLQRLPGMESVCTPLIFDGDIFTGEAGEFTVGEQKMKQLEAFAPAGGKIYAAYGDTLSDKHMLALSENPVAVAPDDGLRQIALENNWRIIEA